MHTYVCMCLYVYLWVYIKHLRKLFCDDSWYSISQEICTRFCCALFCCGYAIVHNEFTWSIYPYSSGLLCWHWGNRQCITTTKHSKAVTVCIFLRIYCSLTSVRTFWTIAKPSSRILLHVISPARNTIYRDMSSGNPSLSYQYQIRVRDREENCSGYEYLRYFWNIYPVSNGYLCFFLSWRRYTYMSYTRFYGIKYLSVVFI